MIVGQSWGDSGKEEGTRDEEKGGVVGGTVVGGIRGVSGFGGGTGVGGCEGLAEAWWW